MYVIHHGGFPLFNGINYLLIKSEVTMRRVIRYAQIYNRVPFGTKNIVASDFNPREGKALNLNECRRHGTHID